jgi:hypothetical protein
MPLLTSRGAGAAKGYGLTTVGRFKALISIGANTTNYVLNTAKVAGYKAGKTDVTLTINSGTYVYGATDGSNAFTVDTSWNALDTVKVINNGVIVGRGGTGGRGANYNSVTSGRTGGLTGYPGLFVEFPTTIDNAPGRIAGGGGGGSGGVGQFNDGMGTTYRATGAGGGGGVGIGPGGASGSSPPGKSAYPGNPGTLLAAGSGTGGFPLISASGGGYGSAGGTINAGVTTSGGAAGNAVVGNSLITWIDFGIRNGSIT